MESDEAGLWMHMDQVEQRLRTSGRIENDAGLNAYIREVVCRLAQDYCDQIRIYVVQTPNFNASMAPNGFMMVWTGLILRAENEAQLAFVLGHELGHFLRRHSVQAWRDARAKTDSLAFFHLMTAAAGVGFAGNLAQLAVAASIFAYSRDHEREADEIGLRMMVDARYDPRESAKVWDNLIEEREAADEPEEIVFFTTHPPGEERMDTLRGLAQQNLPSGKPLTTEREQFLQTTLPFRAAWWRDELRQREFERTQVVLNHLFERQAKLGELHYFRGELHRLRGKDGDHEDAIESYRAAVGTGQPPPETYRSLGILLWKSGQTADARSAFNEYLQLVPDAEDRSMVEFYLEEL